MQRALAAITTTAVTVLAFAAPPIGATTLERFSSFWVLGDSLSDPGNLFEMTGGTIPATPPYDERRSDGPVWAEYVADDFAAKGLPTGNFAVAFANAVPNVDPFPFQIPDLPQQLDSFGAASAGQLGSRPLVSLWFGANDIFEAIRTVPTQQNVVATATNAANAVSDAILGLSNYGVEDVLLFNLPPLDQTPAFTTLNSAAAPLAGLGTLVFNDTLASRLTTFGSEAPDVIGININEFFFEALADPAAFGLTDVTGFCIIPEPVNALLCTEEELATTLFVDPVHPTTAVHAQIAGRVSAQVAPIPLPAPLALLVAGIAALVLPVLRRHNTA